MGYVLKKKIGVIGSAAGDFDRGLVWIARNIGKEIVKHDCFLLTGASGGLPYESVKGAKKHDGFTLGFSPASNLSEHIQEYEFPVDFFDVIVFTGMGLKGRNVLFIRTCDAVIMMSGGTGTLNEFTIAFDEKKGIGVLTGSGGVSDMIEEIAKKSSKKGAQIIYENDSTVLVNKLIELWKK